MEIVTQVLQHEDGWGGDRIGFLGLYSWEYRWVFLLWSVYRLVGTKVGNVYWREYYHRRYLRTGSFHFPRYVHWREVHSRLRCCDLCNRGAFVRRGDGSSRMERNVDWSLQYLLVCWRGEFGIPYHPRPRWLDYYHEAILILYRFLQHGLSTELNISTLTSPGACPSGSRPLQLGW